MNHRLKKWLRLNQKRQAPIEKVIEEVAEPEETPQVEEVVEAEQEVEVQPIEEVAEVSQAEPETEVKEDAPKAQVRKRRLLEIQGILQRD